jgi:Sec-independent protein translocase protein TatA
MAEVLALFESIGGIELLVVGIGALLLFGKDLPKVAADAGAQIAKLKRSLDSTWRESGLDKEVRQIRDALPRDLSLKDVAKSASEKLAIRLEEEERVRNADPGPAGPVARGSLDPVEPIEHGTSLPGAHAQPQEGASSAGSGADRAVGAPSGEHAEFQHADSSGAATGADALLVAARDVGAGTAGAGQGARAEHAGADGADLDHTPRDGSGSARRAD